MRRNLRSLVRSPGFTVSAVLTLAFGIGAVSAIATVTNAVLLRPLPYGPGPDRVMIWSRWTGFEKTWLSAAELLDYRRSTRTLAAVAGWGTGQVTLTGQDDALRVGAAGVTANTFDVLGVRPGLGRTFTEEEDRPGHDRVVILSHPLWRMHYGADAGILDRAILIDGEPRRVVGVMPPGFRLPTDFGEEAVDPTALWVPLAIDPATSMQERGNHGLFGAAVLRPGTSAASASAELASLTAGWTRDGLYPAAMRFTAFAVSFEDEILGGVRPALLLLTAAVALLLLIASANVASLMLVRAEGRQRELALRSALGAGRGRIVRELFVEGLALAVPAAVIGLGLGVIGLRLLFAIDPTIVPRADTVTLDLRVVGFVALATLATTLLFNLAPAWRAWRLDLNDALKETAQSTTAGAGRQRVRALFVVTEVALALMLLVAATLMVRSLWALQRIDLGFEPRGVLTARVSLPEAGYTSPASVAIFYEQLLSRVRGLPGVTAAGAVRSLPLANTIGDYGLDVEGFAELPGQGAKGDWQIVTAGAAEALRERLVRGRFLATTDTAASQPVAVINETLARTYWAGREALGGRLRVGSMASRPWATVVGIVADVKHNGVEGRVKEKFYIAHPQWPVVTNGSVTRGMTLVVRTAGDPSALAAPLRAAVTAIDPNVPLASVRTLESVAASALATPRLAGSLLALFAALAVLLSAVGLYGVLAYLVSQRRQEIGIRMALGADAAAVRRLVIGRGLILAGAGLAVGTVGALLATRVMRSLLHEVQPTDPVAFVGAAAVLGLIAFLASYLPARRATRVDPLIALRQG